MSAGVEAFPLAWPLGWPRVQSYARKSSTYRVTLAQARDRLFAELRLAGARDVVVSSNLTLRLDGVPLANQREPLDPGVAVYWTDRKRRPRVIACDVWRTVRENMRALGLAVECIRGLERTGASEILDRAFSGFAALPETAGAASHWRELGLEPGASVNAIRERYRQLARQRHPDAGGTAAEFSALTAAYNAALAEVAL